MKFEIFYAKKSKLKKFNIKLNQIQNQPKFGIKIKNQKSNSKLKKILFKMKKIQFKMKEIQ